MTYTDYLYKALPLKPKYIVEKKNKDLYVYIDVYTFLETLKFLKIDENSKFQTLIDLTVIHHIDFDTKKTKQEKFEVVYSLLSVEFNRRIHLTFITDLNTFLPSIAKLYLNAEWLEREAYEMFGIIFTGNSNLRRLLTDYGFEGNPLKKDFPLSGYTQMRFSEIQKRVIYEKVTLAQSKNVLEFTTITNPWTNLHEN